MNIAIIIAGGVGSRFGADIPKQFVEVNHKPIMAYTLETFEQSMEIDAIIVVCVASWEDYIDRLRNKFGITKLVSIITGGNSRFESIKKGIDESNKFSTIANDILIIHDAVRPCVTSDQISSSIYITRENGAALAVAPCFDTMFISEDGNMINGVYPREKLFRGQTPESMRLSIANMFYNKALEDNNHIDSPTNLLMYYEQPVGKSLGSSNNLKITTQEDIMLFKTILSNRR